MDPPRLITAQAGVMRVGTVYSVVRRCAARNIRRANRGADARARPQRYPYAPLMQPVAPLLKYNSLRCVGCGEAVRFRAARHRMCAGSVGR